MNSAPPYVLELLGGATLRRGVELVTGRAVQRRRLGLLALLALAPNRTLSRDKLLAYLWPERDAAHARDLLSASVYALRQPLGAELLFSEGDDLRLNAALLTSDVAAFESAVRRGELEAAAALYRGPLLDGFFLSNALEFERWAEAQRDRLAAVYASVIEQLAGVAESAGDAAAAARWWRRLAAHDPYSSRVALRLVSALEAAGERAAALQQAAAHTALLREELGIEPPLELANLAGRLRALPPPPPLPPAPGGPPMLAAAAAAPAATPAFPAPSPAPAPPLAPGSLPLRRRRAWLAGLALLLLVAALGGRALWRGRASPLEPGTVALLPFELAAADASLGWLREGMVELLARKLTGEGGPRAVDPRATLAAAELAQAEGGRRVALSAALATARRLGAGQALLGAVVGTAARLTITASLYDSRTGGVRARVEGVTGPLDSLPALLDRLAAELLSRGAGEDAERIEVLTSASLPALRAYLEGRSLYRRGRFEEAARAYLRAVDIDSSFALAGLGLALATSWTGRDLGLGRGLRIAWKQRSRLKPRDRDFLLAFALPYFPGGRVVPTGELLAAWEELVGAWPDSPEAWYELGDTYFHHGALLGHAGAHALAAAAFREALEVDSAFAPALHHLISVRALHGDTVGLRRLADRYFGRFVPEQRAASHLAWQVANALSDAAWLDTVRSRFSSMSIADLREVAWLAQLAGWPVADAAPAAAALDRRAGRTAEYADNLWLRYALALNTGRPSEALRTGGSRRVPGPGDSSLPVRQALAALFADGDAAMGAAAVARLEARARTAQPAGLGDRRLQRTALCLAEHWRADQGQAEAVGTGIARLRAAVAAGDDPAAASTYGLCAEWLEAMRAARAGGPEAAARRARLDSLLLTPTWQQWWLEAASVVSMRLHEQGGEWDKALAASRRRGFIIGNPYFLSTLLLGEARLAARTGDREGAIRAYRHYLALRPQPERGAPAANVAAARRELARLLGQRTTP
ncbi:MAG: winged helix-turn-helix domain-containing protein [Gemmatimonadetes bacterium]|nr:winged helix-turn-helix domain-containing protein [Gemmatimonadota bacterium]